MRISFESFSSWIIFTVDVKTMQVGITPTHGNLNRVMKVGNAVVTPQEQSPPDHWANATQNHLEGVTTRNGKNAELGILSISCGLPQKGRFGYGY
jgi:hypothetical protein